MGYWTASLGTFMHATKETYPGYADEDADYYESAGAVFTFSEGEREYKFQVEDCLPEYAVSRPGRFDGRSVSVMINAPHAASSLAIEIPRTCPLFRAALVELERSGIKFVSFFNQPTGGYLQLPIREIAGA